MAIQPVEQRLDQMTKGRQVTSTAPGIEVSYIEETPVEPVEQTQPQGTMPEGSVIESPVGESPLTLDELVAEELDINDGVSVAAGEGAIKALGKSLGKKMGKTADQERIEPTIGTPEKVDVPASVTPDELQATIDAVQARKEARELGLETSRKPPEEAYNTARMSDNLADAINGTADALGIPQKTVTFAEIEQLASEIGISKKYISDLIAAPKEPGSEAAEIVRAMQVMKDSGKRLEAMVQKIMDGKASPEDKLAAAQQLAFHRDLQAAVKYKKAEKARSMAAMRIESDAGLDKIEKALDEFGGSKTIEDFARAYSKAKSASDRSLLIEKSWGKTFLDAWMTIRINGLLSSPDTWVKGFISPAIFGMYRIPERMIAGALSKMPDVLRQPIRQYKDIPFTDDELQTLEAFSSQFFSFSQTIRNAFGRAAVAFKENVPLDKNTKLELGSTYDKTISASTFRLSENSTFGRGINYFGKAITLPGRIMLTSDEFWKGVFSDNYIIQAASNRGRQAYKDAIRDGASEAEAMAAMDNVVRSIRTDPPEDVIEGAIEAARRGTFTSDLPGILGKAEKIVQTPAMKILVPFIRSPTNEFLEKIERTPFGLLSGRWWDDFNKGGPSRDMALAKIGLGSMVAYSASEFAMEGLYVGNFIGTKADREAYERMGGQYNALVLPFELFNDDQIKRLGTVFKVSSGGGKTYISMNNIGPAWELFSAGADYAAFKKYAKDEGLSDEVAGGLIAMAYHSMNDVPLLAVFSEVSSLTRGLKEGEINTDQYITNMIALAAKISISGTPAGAYSSATSVLEKYMHGAKTDLNANDINMSPHAKAWFIAMRQYKSKVPGLSDDMPVALNLWGRRNMQPFVPPDEMLMPTGVTFTEFSALDRELLRISNPIREPDYMILGAKITAAQRNELIKIYNLEVGGKQQLDQFIELPEYAAASRGVKQAKIKQIHEMNMKKAEDILISRDFSLANRLAIGKERKLENIFAKPPNPSTIP